MHLLRAGSFMPVGRPSVTGTYLVHASRDTVLLPVSITTVPLDLALSCPLWHVGSLMGLRPADCRYRPLRHCLVQSQTVDHSGRLLADLPTVFLIVNLLASLRRAARVVALQHQWRLGVPGGRHGPGRPIVPSGDLSPSPARPPVVATGCRRAARIAPRLAR